MRKKRIEHRHAKMNRWFAFSPIPNYRDTHGVFSRPRHFSKRVRIERLPTWAVDEKVLKYVYSYEKDHMSKAQLAICAEYDAEALGSPDPNWIGSLPRAIQETVTEEILLLPVASWLVRPTTLTNSKIIHLHREGKSAVFRQMTFHSELLIHPQELEQEIQEDNIKPISVLFRAMINLSKNGTVWTSIWMLNKTLTETIWPVRFLLHWLVLESLFGPEDARETTYRLSQRIGFYLGKDRMEAKDIFLMAKDLYTWRSKIAHGLRIHKLTSEKSLQLMHNLEDLIRRSLTKVLREDHISRFDAKSRETFLDDLVFL